jgi:Transglycosylase SLT domain/Domain of unknown function (DUF4124)
VIAIVGENDVMSKTSCFYNVFFTLTALSLFIPAPSEADIYSYRDEKGTIHLANLPSGGIAPIKKRPVRSRTAWINPAPEILPSLSGNSRYDKLIRRAADRFNVDFEIIKAVIHAESAFNHRAVSRVGARGLMQLMPGTARDMGVRDVFNPEQNIMGGTRYLKEMLELYNNNVKLSLAAYNAGPTAVDRNVGVPPYVETHEFIKRVLKLIRVYGNESPVGGRKLYRVIKNGTVMLSDSPLP